MKTQMGKAISSLLLFMFTGIFLAVGATVYAQDDPRPAVVNKVAPCVVALNSGAAILGCAIIIDGSQGIIMSPSAFGRYADYSVTLDNGSRIEAKKLNTMWAPGVSFFKIDYQRVLPQATLGDSDSLVVGETVIALGAPGSPVSQGVISAIRNSEQPGVQLIQTDAAMSPDNAGGPLINLKGEVVGINTYGSTRYEANTRGIGFAIAINQTQKIKKQNPAKPAETHNSTPPEIKLAPKGASAPEAVKKMQPYLGLQVGAVTKENNGLQETGNLWGVLIEDLDPGGPAALAKLLPGDIIVSLNDSPALNVEIYEDILAQTSIGGATWIEVLRRGKSHMVQVTVEGRPAIEKPRK